MLRKNEDKKISKYDQTSKNVLQFCRKIILKGFTWGEHTDLLMGIPVARQGYENIFTACFRGVSDIRHYDYTSSRIELDSTHSLFESVVRSSFKFNLGNCGEHTLMGLYFCVKNNIEAECYEVSNGDHAFLVIGRAEGSDPSDPNTWGPDAMICDPWDNKSYPACELDSHLKSIFGKSCKIAPTPRRNTRYIQSIRTIENLQKSFCERFENMQHSLHNYLSDLEDISKDLPQEKKPVIENKIRYIREYLLKIPKPAELFEQCNEAAKKEQTDKSLDEYSLTRCNLIYNLEALHNKLQREIMFSSSELNRLNDSTWYFKILKVLSFFGLILTLEDSIEHACSSTSYNIANCLKQHSVFKIKSSFQGSETTSTHTQAMQPKLTASIMS